MEKERATQERNFCFSQIFMKISLISECTDQKNLNMHVRYCKSEKITQMCSLRSSTIS